MGASMTIHIIIFENWSQLVKDDCCGMVVKNFEYALSIPYKKGWGTPPIYASLPLYPSNIHLHFSFQHSGRIF